MHTNIHTLDDLHGFPLNSDSSKGTKPSNDLCMLDDDDEEVEDDDDICVIG